MLDIDVGIDVEDEEDEDDIPGGSLGGGR